MKEPSKERTIRPLELLFLRPFVERNETLAQGLCYLALLTAPALLWLVRHIHSTALTGPVMAASFVAIFLGGGVVKWSGKDAGFLSAITGALTILLGWCVFVYLVLSYVAQAFLFSWVV